MRYFVIATNGKKYGPAGVELLSEWAFEGRLIETTLLEGEDSGVQLPARSIPGIKFANVKPAPTPAPPLMAQSPMNYEFSPAMGGPSAGPAGMGFAEYPRPNFSTAQEVPKGFNWGAFLLSAIWCLAHKKWPFAVGMFVLRGIERVAAGPIALLLQLALSIYVGSQGNQWAWESGRYSTIDEMMVAQKKWATWGWIVLGIFVLLIAGLVYLAMNIPVRPGMRRP